MRALVPAVLLLGDAKDAKEVTEERKEADGAAPSSQDGAAQASTSEENASATSGSGDTAAPQPAKAPEVVGKSPAAGGSDGGAADLSGPTSTSEAAAGGFFAQVDRIIAQLPACYSRDQCDELSIEFCYHNSKAARRRLVRALSDVPRTSLQLLSFYARVIATLSQVFPDVAQGRQTSEIFNH